MAERGSRAGLRMGLAWALVLGGTALARGQEADPRAGAGPRGAGLAALRDHFETERVAWLREDADTTIQLLAHERSDRAAREGRKSERFHFRAGNGSNFFFSYPLPKVLVNEDLRATLYVRSDRAGPQLFARVVLPADIDPDTGQPSFVMVPGTVCDTPGRWQRLAIEDFPLGVKRQARWLRAATRRPVSLEGAYLDRLVVNLYGGAGETEVYLDDLTVLPVPREAALPAATPPPLVRPVAEPGPALPSAPVGTSGAGRGRVRLVGNRLTRDGRDWLFLGISAPGAALMPLHRSGFDLLAVPIDADPALVRDAVRHGFLLMPEFRKPPEDAAAAFEAIAKFPAREAVAFWCLGQHLGTAHDPERRRAEWEEVRRLTTRIRGASDGLPPLTTGEVAGMFEQFAQPPRNLDLIGVRPSGWGTMQELVDVYRYLVQRRELAFANPGTVFWALIPTTCSGTVRRAIWGDDIPPAWGEPQVQPEQVRLFTYAALAAGYRGLCYLDDATLTRDTSLTRRIEMALLREEIALIEPILAEAAGPIRFIDVYPSDPLPSTQPTNMMPGKVKQSEPSPHPSIRAAAIQTQDRRTWLLMLTDFAPGAQFQPGLMREFNLQVTVPAPESAQAFELSPGAVTVIADGPGFLGAPAHRERVPGGIRLILNHFSTTALVLVTTDLSLRDRLEAQVQRVRPRAVQYAITQAGEVYQQVREMNERLRLYWETEPPDPDLVWNEAARHRAGVYLAEARAALAKEDYITARRLVRQAEQMKAPFLPSEDSPKRVASDIDAVENLNAARRLVAEAQDAQAREEYDLAWDAARRASGVLRVVMNDHWQRAFGAMVTATFKPPKEPPAPLGRPAPPAMKFLPRLLSPVSSPSLVSFQTLPNHWLWIDWMRDARFGRSLLPGGSFEDPKLLDAPGWEKVGEPTPGLVPRIAVVPRPKDPPVPPPLPNATIGPPPVSEELQQLPLRSKRVLRLKVEPVLPKDVLQPPANLARDPARANAYREKRLAEVVDALPPFLDRPVAAIRTPPVRVRAKQLIRVRMLVQKPMPNVPGGGGLIIRDSIGGAPLQFRTTDAIPEWSELILYRRAPETGPFTVTVGLAGYGDVFLDDLRIEVAVEPPRGRRELPENHDDAAPPPPEVRRPAGPTARRPARGRVGR